jgi:flagellar basal-body rod protein FlgG
MPGMPLALLLQSFTRKITARGEILISGVFRLMDGSLAQQLRFENISNNLANINTNGFKKDILSFDKALALNNLSSIDFSPGPIVHTGNNLDIAIGGSGFFKIQTSEGVRYTRDGAFTLDNQGRIVTRNGDTVLGLNGPITIRDESFSVNRDGQVNDKNGSLGTLAIVDFKEPRLLKKEGASHYVYAGARTDILPAENPDVQQSYLEKSNVNPSEEMIKMIEAYRNFESVQKAIQSMDEVTNKMVNDPDLL